MVFSAPEMTTVSKPNKNPARAEVSDQKKMRAFIVRSGPRTLDLGPQDLRLYISGHSPQSSHARHTHEESPRRLTVDLQTLSSHSLEVPRGARGRGPSEISLSPADIPSPATPECRHPSKSRSCNPSSEDCRQRGRNEILLRNKGPSPG